MNSPLSYFIIAHNAIVKEYLRRIILNDLRDILAQTVCTNKISVQTVGGPLIGAQNVSLEADPAILTGCVERFNYLARIIGEDFKTYPNNIQSLYIFTSAGK